MAVVSKRSLNCTSKTSEHKKGRREATKKRPIVSKYKGWVSDGDCKIAELCEIPSPLDFFKGFIAPRKPVVLRGYDNKCSTLQCEKLSEIIGMHGIEVERRETTDSSFGQVDTGAREIKDTAEVVKEMCNGLVYASTQSHPEDHVGPTRILSPHVRAFLERLSIEKRPPAMGNLIPYQINLWIGGGDRSAQSSSGLHHDFHDNLYVLYKGTKTFRLFSPNHLAECLETEGLYKKTKQPVVIHPNGLICYDGETREDGSVEETSQLDDEDMLLEMALDAYVDKKKRKTEKPASRKPKPDSFSRVFAAEDTGVAYSEVVLGAGDALFLPASWFHEVISSSVAESDAQDKEKLHVALNYWFYPPCFSHPFDRPYLSDFWQDRFTTLTEASLYSKQVSVPPKDGSFSV